MRGTLLAAVFLSVFCVVGAQGNTPSEQSVPTITNVIQPAQTNASAPASLAADKGNNCAATHYPAMAIRQNHEGSVVVNVHIDDKGNVTGVDTGQSSGWPELDDAARQCVISAWHFVPATVNGKPVPSAKQYRIVWKLTGPPSSAPWLKADPNGVCNAMFWSDKNRWTTFRAATIAFRLSAAGTVLVPFTAISSGDPVFNAKAVECMSKLSYSPAILGGVPLEMSWTATVLWSPQTGLGFADGRDVGPGCPDEDFPASVWNGDPPNPTDISFQMTPGMPPENFAIEQQSGNVKLDQAAMMCVKEQMGLFRVGAPGTMAMEHLFRFFWHKGRAFVLNWRGN